MRYVDIHRDTKAVTWDRYFEYLRNVESAFPLPLRTYAMNWSHYSLDGEDSLHDAWLSRIEFGSNERSLTLEFLGSKHDRKHVFCYTGVKQYIVDVNVEFSFGDRDVLAQEFRVEETFVTHEVVFSSFGSLIVTSKSIVPERGKA